MGLKETLSLVISADVKGAIRGFEDVGKAADKNLGKTNNSLDKLGGKMQAVGAGAIGVGSVMLFGLGKAAQASEEANLASLKLQNSLKNNPKLAGASAKSFEDLANAIQGKTAADGDAIIAGQAMLATFRVTADQLKGLTPLVVDYSRKFGIDLVDANAQVGKALDGSIGALKRNGVTIDENLFKTDRYKAVVEALRTQVGGFAEEEGKTFAGSLERMKNELGDLEEGVGRGAVNAFSTLFGVVDKATGAFEGLAPGTQSAIGELATFGAIGLVAAGGVSTLAGTVIKAKGSVDKLGSALGLSGSALSGFKTAIGGAAIATAGAATAWAIWQARMQQGSEAAGKLGNEVQRIFGNVQGLDQWNDKLRLLQNNIDNLRSAKSGSSAPWDADYRADLGKGIDTLSALQSKYGDVARQAEELAASTGMSRDAALQQILAQKGQADAAAALTPETRALNEETEKQATSAGDAADAVKKMLAPTTKLADEQKRAADAVQELSDKLNAQFDPLFGMLDALNADRDAQKEAADAATEHGYASQEYADAAVKAAQAALGVQDASIKLEGAVRNGSVSVDEAKRTLQAWVAQGLITQASADTTAGKFDIVSQKADALQGKNVQVAVDANTWPAESKLAALGQRLERLADGTTTIEVDIASRAPGPRRWGGVDYHMAAGGTIGAHFATAPTVLYGERATGGEAFIPRIGDRSRSMAILREAAGWYGADVTSGRGGVTLNLNAADMPVGAALDLAVAKLGWQLTGRGDS